MADTLAKTTRIIWTTGSSFIQFIRNRNPIVELKTVNIINPDFLFILLVSIRTALKPQNYVAPKTNILTPKLKPILQIAPCIPKKKKTYPMFVRIRQISTIRFFLTQNILYRICFRWSQFLVFFFKREIIFPPSSFIAYFYS